MPLMTIRAALDRIKTVEENLSITDPESLTIKRVYKYWPAASAEPEAPCFMHTFDVPMVDHRPNQQRKQLYIVQTSFWSGNPDKDRAADISAAFLAKWLDAFSNNLTLSGTCTGPIKLRGGAPTLASLEFGGLQSIGLSLFMEIPMGPEAVTVGP